MRLGSIFGIEIRISWLMPFGIAAGLLLGSPGTLALIFLAVFLHEIGHCIAAAMLSLKIDCFEILPIGARAKISGLSGSPAKEAAVAMFGPATNGMLGMWAFFLSQFLGLGDAWRGFIEINIMLAVFNLLPALPLDGGRILRAALCGITAREKAGAITVWVSRIIGAAIAGYGVYCAIVFGTAQVFVFAAAGLILFSARKERNHYEYARLVSARSAVLEKNRALEVTTIAMREDMTFSEAIKMMTALKFHIIILVDASMREICRFNEKDIMRGYVLYGAQGKLGRLAG